MPASITYAVSPVAVANASRAAMFATTVVPADVRIPCSTTTANGTLPLCTLKIPISVVILPVMSSSNISPPSALANFTYFAVEADVDKFQPVQELLPATAEPLPSFVTFTIVIAPPVEFVSTTFVPDTDAVILVGPTALISAVISAAIPTAIPYVACPAVVVENVTDVPLIVITPPGYIPTRPYTKELAPVVAVVGAGVSLAVTPCVDVPLLV